MENLESKIYESYADYFASKGLGSEEVETKHTYNKYW